MTPDWERRAMTYKGMLYFASGPLAVRKAEVQIAQSEHWSEAITTPVAVAPIRILAKPVAREVGGKRRKSA